MGKLFRRGELPGVVFSALRKAPEGLDTREFAGVCLRYREMDDTDIVRRRSMTMKITGVLDQLRIKGRIDKAGMRAGVIVWRLPA